jgi:hypothetical protein
MGDESWREGKSVQRGERSVIGRNKFEFLNLGKLSAKRTAEALVMGLIAVVVTALIVPPPTVWRRAIRCAFRVGRVIMTVATKTNVEVAKRVLAPIGVLASILLSFVFSSHVIPAHACVAASASCVDLPVPDCKDQKNQRSLFWPDIPQDARKLPFAARVTVIREMEQFERQARANGKIPEVTPRKSLLVHVDEVLRGRAQFEEAEIPLEICTEQADIMPGASGIVAGSVAQTTGDFWLIIVNTFRRK